MNQEKSKQKELAEASLKIVKRILEISPQYSGEDLNYLICGSLITNILPLVKKMDDVELDKESGALTPGKTIEIDPEAQEEFLDVVRPSRSNDIDIAVVGKDPYSCSADSKRAPNAGEIKLGLEKEFEMVFPGCHTYGDTLDRLETVRKMPVLYMTKATLEDGTELMMPSLDAILVFKCREALQLRGEKGRKKKEDFVKLYRVASKLTDASPLKKYYDQMVKELEKSEDPGEER